MPHRYAGPISCGDIWYAPKVRSPDNEWEAKDRRLLIIWPDKPVDKGGRTILLAVGISRKPSQEKINQSVVVKLPDKQTYSDTTSGLNEPCWAVAPWVIQLTPCYLDNKAGYLEEPEYVERIREILPRIKFDEKINECCDPASAIRCDYCL